MFYKVPLAGEGPGLAWGMQTHRPPCYERERCHLTLRGAVMPDDKSHRNEPKKPDFSNVQSGSSTVSSNDRPGAAGTTYVVKPGDSLSKIAQHHYGDAQAWRRIYEANKDQIQDPDLIQPGWTLRLP